MFSAIQQGYYLKAIEQIESASNVNIRDGDGKTPLIRCVLLKDQHKAVGLARALLANGAKISKRDKDGLNALHYCCIESLPLLVEVLLAALDCDVNARCRKTGNTALHFSAIAGNDDVSRKLVSHITRYRLNIDVQNRVGETPLAIAIKFCNNRIADLFLSNGANFQLITKTERVRKPSVQPQQSANSTKSIRKRNRQQPHKLKTPESTLTSAKSSAKSANRKISFATSDEPTRKQQMFASDISTVSTEVIEVSWREIIPMIWNKYTQQNSASFRRPADLEQGAEVYKLLAEQANLEAEELAALPTAAARRRNSSMAYLGPPISRRGSLFQAAKAPPSKFESMRSRRQSVAV